MQLIELREYITDYTQESWQVALKLDSRDLG